MAGNEKKLKSEGMRLEPLDLDNLDDFWGDDVSEKEGVISRFTTSFKRGFLEQTKTRNLISAFARTSLPEGYATAARFIEDVPATLRQIGGDIESTHYNDLAVLTSFAQKNLPRIKGKTSEKLYATINDRLRENREKYAIMREANRDPAQAQAEYKANAEDAELQELLDGNGDRTQLDIALAMDENADARFIAEAQERSVRDTVNKDRFDIMSRALGTIVNTQQKQVAFQDQITYRYQRRGLELQFRTLMTLRDIRKLSDAQMKMQEQAYKIMINNSAIPDHLKSTKSAKGQGNLAMRVASAPLKMAFNSLPGMVGNFGPGVKDRLSQLGGGAVQQLAQGLGAGDGMFDMMLEQFQQNRAGMVGDLAGRGTSMALQQLLIPMLARRVRPKLERASNRYGGGRHNQLQMMFENAPAMLQEFANDPNRRGGISGYLQKAAGLIAPQFQLDPRVQNGNYQTIGKQTAFNQLTQRSIVEVIPGYLARILHTTRMIQAGTSDVPFETYDITRGEFTERSKANNRLERKIVGRGQRRNAAWAVNSALDEYDEGGDLSVEARHALGERLVRDAATNKRFDPNAYSSSSGWGEGTTDETLAELRGFFKSKFKFDADGKMVTNDATNNAKLKDFSRAFINIRDLINDPISEINRLLETGNIGALRELGLVISVEGQDRINYNRIWELQREGVTDTNPNPSLGDPDRYTFEQGDLKADLKEQWNNAKDALRNKKAQAGEMFNQYAGDPRLKIGRDAVESRFQDAVARANDVRRRLDERSGGKVSSAEEAVKDLYQKGTNKVLLLAHDIEAGELMDVTTQTIIEKVEDIKGTVVDKDGNIVLTQEDVRRGFEDVTGKAIELGRALRGGGLPSRVREILTGVKARLEGALTDENGIISRVKDIYTENAEEPLLLAREMARGKYIDVTTQKVIESVDDIAGPVMHGDTEQIVLTNEDIEKGLVDNTGKKITSSKLVKALRSYLGMMSNPMRIMGRMAMNVAGKVGRGIAGVAGWLFGKAFNADAYLPGQDKPVLTSAKLKQGEYYGYNGKVLKSFDDLRDGVYDIDGQVVVDTDDVPNLVTRSGKKHTAAKQRSALRKLSKRAVVGASKGYAGMTKAYYGWLGGKIFGKKINKTTGQREETVDESKLETPTDKLLARILTALKEGLPGSGPRKGSWQEQLATDKEKGDEKDGPGGTGAKGGKGIFGGLAGIMERLRGKRDDEEGDEEGGGDINIDASGNDGEKKKGRRRAKPKTKLGRLMRRVGNSRVGRVAGRAASGLGWLARGALGVAGLGGMAGVGSALAGGASAIGSGLLAAGGLLAGIVSAPAVLIGAAAVGAGAGAYWLYSRHRDTSGDFRSLRLLQYGVNSTSLGLKVLEVESIMEEVTTKGENPTWSFGGETAAKVMKALGVNGQEEPAKVAKLAKWMDLRFKPVFIAYVKAIGTLANGSLKVNEIDDKFPAEQKGALLEAVKFPYGGDGPYGMMDDPTGDENPLEVTSDEIKAKFESLQEKFKGQAANKSTAATASTVLKTAAGTATAAAGVAATAAPTGIAQASVAESSTALKVAKSVGSALLKLLPMGGMLISASQVIEAVTQKGALTSLQAIRMRAYGLGSLDAKNTSFLLSVESLAFKNMAFGEGGVARYEGDVSLLIEQVAPMFGVNPKGMDTAERSEMNRWLLYRFMPVFMAYLQAAKAQAQSINTLQAIESLDVVSKVAVGNAVIAAVTDRDGSKQSIWQQPNIFERFGGTDPSSLEASAKTELARLEKEATKTKLPTPVESAQQQQSKEASSWSSSAAAAASGAVAMLGRARDSLTSNVKSAWGSVKGFFGFGDEPSKGNAGAPYEAGKTPTYNGPLAVQGNVYEGFTKGTGGAFETIPLPTSNKSREAAMVTLKAVEAMTGVSAFLLATFASIESGFDYLVKASTSSATGWFQFINSTWDGMLKNHAAKYGIPADSSDRKLRKDPRINALMGAEFLKENNAILSRGLGRPATDVDLYAAHFFGAYTALKFLKMDPNSFAGLALTAQAAANPSIFKHKSGMWRTVREVYQLFEEKVSKHRKGGDSTNILLQQKQGETDPVKLAEEQAKAAAASAQAEAKDAPQEPTESVSSQVGAVTGPIGIFPTGAQPTKPVTNTPVGGGAPTSPEAMDTTSPSTSAPALGEEAVRQTMEVAAGNAAKKKDKLNDESVRQNMEAAKVALDLQQQQVALQKEMRDYLKELVAMGKTPASPGKRANGIEQTPSVPARASGNSRPPIDMTR